MENNKIPTVEEYIKQHPYVDSFLSSAQGYDVLVRFMTEFAKLHVQAALKEASERAETTYESHWSGEQEGYSYVDKDSILNAYPLDNIK